MILKVPLTAISAYKCPHPHGHHLPLAFELFPFSAPVSLPSYNNLYNLTFSLVARGTERTKERTGALNENIVQNHLNIALLNVF